MATISVIIPVYNVENYLHRCLDSLLAQTFADFEVILVDDGSKDSSGSICDTYAQRDPRFVVFHQENQGQAVARNFALDWMFQNSDSEYVSFIDSDDWVHPKYLELLFHAAIEYGVNIIQCLFEEIDGTDDAPSVENRITLITPEEQYTRWYNAFFCTKLFSRLCLNNIRFPEGRIYEDVAIWYRVLFAEKQLALVQETLYYYYCNPHSTIRKDWKPIKLTQLEVWQPQLKFLQNYGNDRVFESSVTRFFIILSQHLDSEAKSSAISGREKRKYCRVLKRKVLCTIVRFRKTSTVKKNLRKYLGLCFPGTMRLLRKCRSIAREFE